MRHFILFIVFIPLAVFASGPGSPENQNEYAQVVIVGKPTKVSEKIFLNEKEYSEEEVKAYMAAYKKRSGKDFANNEEAYPRFQVEFTIVIKVSTVVRGSFVSEELKVKWRDLAGSMCPHIPRSAFTAEGIWYSGSPFQKGEHDHSIYWMPHIEDNLKVILSRKTAE